MARAYHPPSSHNRTLNQVLHQHPSQKWNELLTHQPIHLDNWVGNETALQRAREWFARVTSTEAHDPQQLSNESTATTPNRPILYLHGPDGVDKTTLINILCKQFHCNPLTITNADVRSKKRIQDWMQSHTQSQSIVSLFGNSIATREHPDVPVVVMDDIGVMSCGDKGGLHELIYCCADTVSPSPKRKTKSNVSKHSSKSACAAAAPSVFTGSASTSTKVIGIPVVCISNAPYSVSSSISKSAGTHNAVTSHIESIQFVPPTVDEIAKWGHELCKQYMLPFGSTTVKRLAGMCSDGNLRRFILLLHKQLYQLPPIVGDRVTTNAYQEEEEIGRAHV